MGQSQIAQILYGPTTGSRDRNGRSFAPKAPRCEGHSSDVHPDKIGQTDRLLTFTEYGVCMVWISLNHQAEIARPSHIQSIIHASIASHEGKVGHVTGVT